VDRSRVRPSGCSTLGGHVAPDDPDLVVEHNAPRCMSACQGARPSPGSTSCRLRNSRPQSFLYRPSRRGATICPEKKRLRPRPRHETQHPLDDMTQRPRTDPGRRRTLENPGVGVRRSTGLGAIFEPCGDDRATRPAVSVDTVRSRNRCARQKGIHRGTMRSRVQVARQVGSCPCRRTRSADGRRVPSLIWGGPTIRRTCRGSQTQAPQEHVSS